MVSIRKETIAKRSIVKHHVNIQKTAQSLQVLRKLQAMEVINRRIEKRHYSMAQCLKSIMTYLFHRF